MKYKHKTGEVAGIWKVVLENDVGVYLQKGDMKKRLFYHELHKNWEEWKPYTPTSADDLIDTEFGRMTQDTFNTIYGGGHSDL